MSIMTATDWALAALIAVVVLLALWYRGRGNGHVI